MKLQDVINHDIEGQLPKKKWVAGWRARTSYIVWHFNGPPVPENRTAGAGLIEQLHIDCGWQMRQGWAGVPSGADGLQYHYVIGQDGAVYRTRHPNASLWHCGHRKANPEGIAIHLPIGLDEGSGTYQAPSDAMQQSLERLTNALRAEYAIDRERVVGHVELGTTAYCPGSPLMGDLRAYRTGKSKKPVEPFIEHPPLPHLQRYRVRRGGTATVRQGPARAYQVVRNLKGRAPDEQCPDRLIWVDAIKHDEQGLTIDGGKRWMHMAYIPDEQMDEGFIHETGLELVDDRAEPPEPQDQIADAQAIIGGPFVPDWHLFKWMNANLGHVPEDRRHALARAYNYCGRLFGISNWIPLHQAIKETGNFRSERFVSYNNVAGIGATNDGARGAMFETVEQAVFAQFLHLYHYAARDDASEFLEKIADANPRLEPLLASHGRGSAPRWLDLHQKWAVVNAGEAVPGPTDKLAYGMNIINRARNAWNDLN